MKVITVETTQTEGKNPSLIQQVGFTLIELSIVLVIIGLIVGGVLVGQDLIKAAEIRATIGQYEKYNAAMNTFRTKYNGMPGDLLAASSTAFGIDPAAGAHAGTTGLGDGNGLLTDTAATNLNAPVGETVLVWQQLSAANLLDGSYGSDIATTGQIIGTTPATYLPGAKLGRGNYWAAGSAAGLNYYGLINPSALVAGAAATAAYTIAAGGGLTPIESFNIDSKLDDGMPATGIIQARGSAANTAAVDAIYPNISNSATTWGGKWSTATAASAVSGDCVTTGASATGTTNTYARGATPGGAPACQLRMRFN